MRKTFFAMAVTALLFSTLLAHPLVYATPAPRIILTPGDGTRIPYGDVEVTWMAVENAMKYTLILHDVATDQDRSFLTTKDTHASIPASVLRPDSQWGVVVVSIDEKEQKIASEMVLFTMEANINNVTLLVGADTALACWNTSEPSNSFADYGPTGYDHGAGQYDSTTTHSVTITSLVPDTNYLLRVRSRSVAGVLETWSGSLTTLPQTTTPEPGSLTAMWAAVPKTTVVRVTATDLTLGSEFLTGTSKPGDRHLLVPKSSFIDGHTYRLTFHAQGDWGEESVDTVPLEFPLDASTSSIQVFFRTVPSEVPAPNSPWLTSTPAGQILLSTITSIVLAWLQDRYGKRTAWTYVFGAALGALIVILLDVWHNWRVATLLVGIAGISPLLMTVFSALASWLWRNLRGGRPTIRRHPGRRVPSGLRVRSRHISREQ